MRHVALVFLLLSWTLSVAQSDNLDTKILQLLELSGSETNFNAAVDNMLAMQREQSVYAAVPEAWWDDFSTEMHARGWPELAPKMVEIYRNNYTEAEIDHQLAYLSDPITQAMVAKQPVVMKLSMDAGAAWGKGLAEEIAAKLEAAAAAAEEKN